MKCRLPMRIGTPKGDGVNYVEYIESGGSQYIDTGFMPNNNTRVVLKAEIPSIPSSNAWLFGSRQASSSGRYSCYLGEKSLKFGYGSTTAACLSASANTSYTIDYNKNAYNINGTSGSFSATTFQNTYSIYLFAENRVGTVSEYSSYKLYSCQIYDNGTLVRDYKPALDPDGVACLYEELSKTYYYNKGSGTFSTGASTGGNGGGGTTQTEYTINVTGTGNSSNLYLTINGTKVTSAGTYKISPGDTIYCYCKSAIMWYGSTITVDGTIVKSANQNTAIDYTFAPSGNCGIALSYNTGATCSITIVT